MITNLITLRDAVAEDLPFLACLYADTRRHEVNTWDWPPEQQEWFLRMQFDAQRMSYQASFPGAFDRIVLRDDMAIGRILTNQDEGSMRLIDIALIEEQRRQGIGTYLLRNLLEQCQKRDCTLHLQVLQGSPAIRLYQRFGFRQAGEDSMYLRMEWVPQSCPKELAC